ncbi:MAG: SusC/RagA family TonB-linked outer membrane protein, partial [Bacteroidales bacterium]|nr:SusC/RagA family TonB-linked outer membrane protein [Bacteroidales bacterium]
YDAGVAQAMVGNQFREVTDYWTPENPNAQYPNWRDGEVRQFDDGFLQNASFLRLKNLSLYYTLDKKVLDATKVFTNARVFATARNLFTVTKFKGVDPEYDGNVSGGTATNAGMYGNSRQFSLGIELQF